MLASACAWGFDGLVAKSFTQNCAQKQTSSRRLPTSQAVLLVNTQRDHATECRQCVVQTTTQRGSTVGKEMPQHEAHTGYAQSPGFLLGVALPNARSPGVLAAPEQPTLH